MNMKKVILIRCLFGGPNGLLICHVITIVISMSINDGSFYAVVPELISICRNEINAVINQDMAIRIGRSKIRAIVPALRVLPSFE